MEDRGNATAGDLSQGPAAVLRAAAGGCPPGASPEFKLQSGAENVFLWRCFSHTVAVFAAGLRWGRCRRANPRLGLGGRERGEAVLQQ